MSGLNWVRKQINPHEEVVFSTDFRDAFHTLPLRQDDRCYVICKGLHGRYHVSRVVLFGLAAGPCVCYVDDPLAFVKGRTLRQSLQVLLLYIAVWMALGLQLSWNKACRGSLVQWIGFELQLHGRSNADLTVRVTESLEKLLNLFTEVRSYKGVLPLLPLQTATGILGWVSSVVRLSRPYSVMLWAAIVQQRHGGPARLPRGFERALCSSSKWNMR